MANLRGANRDDGKARLVLDLDDAARPDSFLIDPKDGQGYRLVVDLLPAGGAAAAAAAGASPERIVKKAPDASGQRDLVIAIDPGHGGKDPGARGRGGTLEKDVTLAIARRLKKRIDLEPGVRAILVRDGDYFIGLGQRVQFVTERAVLAITSMVTVASTSLPGAAAGRR